MNTKVLTAISAALVVASFGSPASAEPLSDHPAVVVARTWNNRPIDTNTFIVAPPASTRWVSEAPKSANEPAHASQSPKLHWSAAIGTGNTARATGTSSAKLNAAVAESDRVTASPDWTATIGTGTAATSASNTRAPLAAGSKSTVAATHWTSKIGSGRAADSVSPVTYTSVANVR